MKTFALIVLAGGVVGSAVSDPERARFDECATAADSVRAEASDAALRPVWAPDGVPDGVWRLADAASVVDDDDDRKCYLREAEREARAAVDEAASVDRRFALAVVLGLRADREGGRTKVRAASQLHDELRAILEVEPEHARARHLLGRLHAGVMRMDRVTRWIATNLLGGGALKEASWEEAEQNLAFAERQVPEVLDHHQELGRLYEDTDRPELAAEEAEHVLGLRARSDMEQAVRVNAARMLARVRKR